jgi:hypothetical protein
LALLGLALLRLALLGLALFGLGFEPALEGRYVELGALSLEPALRLAPAPQGPQAAFAVLGGEVVERVPSPGV